ncbi:MAG: hypothetical protein Q7R39_14615 [Dehalococcoidia bacterium]|nr:hypothetical protein [Dehalococcoidia bacterium]
MLDISEQAVFKKRRLRRSSVSTAVGDKPKPRLVDREGLVAFLLSFLVYAAIG